jgi:hypothetical protein
MQRHNFVKHRERRNKQYEMKKELHHAKTLFFLNKRNKTKFLSNNYFVFLLIINGKAIPLQAWTITKGSRKLRLPDFKTIDI